MGKTELERQRCKRGNSEKSVRGRGVGQKVSTAARDTVENVAWKCSLSCGSLTPAVTPRHAEACLFMHAWDAGGDFFFISLMHSCYLSAPHPPHSSVHALSPQATVSDKPFHCHSDSITCELCLPLKVWRAHYNICAEILWATFHCMWRDQCTVGSQLTAFS